MNDDLASGFRDVDRAAEFAVFSSCLTLVNSIPFFAECKARAMNCSASRRADGSWTWAAAWATMPRCWRSS